MPHISAALSLFLSLRRVRCASSSPLNSCRARHSGQPILASETSLLVLVRERQRAKRKMKSGDPQLAAHENESGGGRQHNNAFRTRRPMTRHFSANQRRRESTPLARA